MAKPLSEQRKIEPPRFDISDFAINMLDLDPEIHAKDLLRGNESKLLEEKRQVRVNLLRSKVNKTLTSVSKNKSTAFNQLASPRHLV
jgi:hypothetical protein